MSGQDIIAEEATMANGMHEDEGNNTNNNNIIDDEDEVSLSDTSLSTDDDSSGDEGYEDESEDDDDMFNIEGVQSMDEFGITQSIQSNKTMMPRRASSFIASVEDNQRYTHDGASVLSRDKNLHQRYHHNIHHFAENSSLRLKRNVYLDEIQSSIPSMEHGQITTSLALSMASQHAQLARALLELLDEKDRQDVCRRKNLRRALLLSSNRGNNDVIVEDDSNNTNDECPLLTMIKSGPLYKLHIKGGRKASTKIRNKVVVSKQKGSSGGNNNINTRRMVTRKLLTKWKPKFVECRKGILSYYDDTRKSSYSMPKKTSLSTYSSNNTSNSDNGLVRKNVPLQASICICRAVDYFGRKSNEDVDESNNTRLYAFELSVRGLPTRLFAAGTEAGRQAWIQAICKGMVGACGNDVDDDAVEDITSVHDSVKYGDGTDGQWSTKQLQKFLTLSQAASAATTATQYTENFVTPFWGSTISAIITSLWKLISPILSEGKAPIGGDTNSHNELEDFWGALKRYTFSFNGRQVFRGNSIHGPERTFGALTRCILECDKSNNIATGASMTEMQAARFVRDILRTTVGEYSQRAASLEVAVNALCHNKKDLAVIRVANENESNYGSAAPPDAPIIKISVSNYNHNQNDLSPVHQRFYDKREWLHVRANNSKYPRRCFAILSVGVLCFYREAYPRPHKLIGQLFLVGARIGFRTNSEFGSSGFGPDSSSHTADSMMGKKEEGSLMSSESNSNHSSDVPQCTMKRPKFIIYVSSKEKKGGERHLCFTDYEQFSEWRDALVLAVDSCSSSPSQGVENPTSMDELLSERQQQPHESNEGASSTALAMYTSPSRLPLLETDEDGITWITRPGAACTLQDSSMKVSTRLLSSFASSRRGSGNFMPYTSILRLASSRMILGPDSSMSSTVRAVSAVSAISKRMPKSKKKFTPKANVEGAAATDSIRSCGDIIENDGLIEPMAPTVELEVKFSRFHHLCLQKDAQKNELA